MTHALCIVQLDGTKLPKVVEDADGLVLGQPRRESPMARRAKLQLVPSHTGKGKGREAGPAAGGKAKARERNARDWRARAGGAERLVPRHARAARGRRVCAYNAHVHAVGDACDARR
jgi:hypothetical protein